MEVLVSTFQHKHQPNNKRKTYTHTHHIYVCVMRENLHFIHWIKPLSYNVKVFWPTCSISVKQEMSDCLRVSVAVKRHRDHGNPYKGQHLIVVAYSSKVQPIIIVAEHDGVQADMVLER